MNTKLISNTRPKSLPNFPELEMGKRNRIFTRHFTNLHLWLSQDEISLLSWLCYHPELRADNTIKYSEMLLKQYSRAVKFAFDEYDTNNYCNISVVVARLRIIFKQLIEKGLLLPADGLHMINPMITYNPSVVNNKNYTVFMKEYQEASPDQVVNKFSILVRKFLESKKKNYTYGKR